MRIVVAVGVLLSARATSQQTKRVPRVALVFGVVPLAAMAGANPSHPAARAFMQGLRDAGLVEGRNIVIERRSAEGRGIERLTALMQEVVSLDVDVIVVTGAGASIAKRATDRIPIVAVANNPLETGLIDSLARPGRNLTGWGESNPATSGKLLQILKEAAPAISRVAVLGWHVNADGRRALRIEAESAARNLQLTLVWLDVDKPEEFEAAFATSIRERADALIAFGTHVNYSHRQRIADFALKQRMPSLGFADVGMLLEYGADDDEGLHRAAFYVKKILDGAKPADLPFEQPTKYSLTVNLKTAKALGITVPHSLMVRADEVIQ